MVGQFVRHQVRMSSVYASMSARLKMPEPSLSNFLNAFSHKRVKRLPKTESDKKLIYDTVRETPLFQSLSMQESYQVIDCMEPVNFAAMRNGTS